MNTTCTIPRFQELSSSADRVSRLDELAESIATLGICQHESAIRRFANQLRGRHLDHRCSVLIDVMADRDQPSVARERAFGHLHSLSLTQQGNIGRHAA